MGDIPLGSCNPGLLSAAIIPSGGFSYPAEALSQRGDGRFGGTLTGEVTDKPYFELLRFPPHGIPV